MLIAAASLTAGCVTGNDCEWAEPIRPSVADVLTDGTVEQILSHNVKGERFCGWK